MKPIKSVLAVITMGFLNLPLFADGTKEVLFWRWFQDNEDRLFSFEKDRAAVFDELSKAMHKVHPDLTFEFSPVLDDGRREFVISAAGIKAAFPAVEAVYAAAPDLKRWKFIKFRPRRTPINDLEYADKRVRAKDVHYILFKDDRPGKIGVMIFLDGYKEDEKPKCWGQIGYLFLDEALGEYDVETKVGAVVFQSRESKFFARAFPLPELPKDFDNHFGNHEK
jgi:hypothetical protein